MADEVVLGLTESDRNVLLNLIEENRQRYRSGRTKHDPPDVGNAPDVYIARTPDGGIPALNVEIPAPSIITGTGTDIYDEPGSATCTIYAMRSPVYGTGPDELRSAGFTRTVYNLSTSAIPANTWVTVWRDKFGRWFAMAPDCALIEKTITSLCWHGTVLKQVFRIRQGCRVLATGCEDVKDCGVGCMETGALTGTSTTGGVPGASICSPTAGGITGTTGAIGGSSTCQCSSTGWAYLTFTVSGVTDGNCSLCTTINGNWCLAQRGTPNCSWTGIRFTATPCGLGYVQALVQNFDDGSCILTFVSSNINNNVVTLATYYCRFFQTGFTDLTGTYCQPYVNTFTLIANTCDCYTWPTAIVATPTPSNTLCTVGAGTCAACGAHTFATLTVPAGWTNGTCTLCANIPAGGPYTLTLSGSCTWLLDPSATGLVCGAVGFASFELLDNGTTGWDLYVVFSVGFATIAIYHLDYASWSCTAANVMNLVSSTGLCNVTATVTVQFV